jgi:hypothetical protein
VYRVWLLCLGLRFEEREPGAVSRENRMRVDALFTASAGFGIVDLILGACMQARHLTEAMRSGDRLQVLGAIGIEVAQLAVAGKAQTHRERKLIELARGLAQRDLSPDARAILETAMGVGLFTRGRWREASELLERTQYISRSRVGLSNARIFAAHSLVYLGRLKEYRERTARLCVDAEERGDLYTIVNLRTAGMVRATLMSDDPGQARREMRDALAQWPRAGFLAQHWQAMVYTSDIELYTGEAAAGYERFMRDMPALRRSLLLKAGIVRAMTFYARGRLAVASIESDPARRDARVAIARRMARRLEREHDPWTGVLASAVRAAAANALADREGAIAALRETLRRAEATDTIALAVPARYRLGELLGGAAGDALTKAASDELIAQGIRNPARWVAIFIPGRVLVPEVAVALRQTASSAVGKDS